MVLVVIVQFSEMGVAFEWFLLAISLVGFDQGIKDEIRTPEIGTYPMFP